MKNEYCKCIAPIIIDSAGIPIKYWNIKQPITRKTFYCKTCKKQLKENELSERLKKLWTI